jgi:zinc transport system ATP-binding protein
VLKMTSFWIASCLAMTQPKQIYKSLMSILSVQNLSFHYDNLPNIFEDVSFEIQKGEFIGLIGSNGSGKTTLIKTILGILKPVSGNVQIFGQSFADFNTNSKNWAKVGHIPQTASQPKDFPITVKELLEISVIKSKQLLPNSVSNSTLVNIVLDKLKITHLQNSELGELSGGQRQKVYIARAIINNPQLIFLDEPTTGIDQLSETDFYELIAALRNEFGTAVVMISHDIGSISSRVDRIFCLDKTLEIIDNPKDYVHSQHIHVLTHSHVH